MSPFRVRIGRNRLCAVEKLSCGADTFDAAVPGGVSLRQGKPSENVANGRQAAGLFPVAVTAAGIVLKPRL